MKSPLRLMAFAAVAVIAFGCVESEPADDMSETSADAAAPADEAADMEAIRSLREQERAAVSAGDIDAYMAILGDEAVIMPPGDETVQGRDAIRAWGEELLSTTSLEAAYDQSDITIEGDLAVERYTGSITVTPAEGESIEERMRGIHVYRRQADGSWKLVQDIWNSPEAPPEMGGEGG